MNKNSCVDIQQLNKLIQLTLICTTICCFSSVHVLKIQNSVVHALCKYIHKYFFVCMCELQEVRPRVRSFAVPLCIKQPQVERAVLIEVVILLVQVHGW